MPGGRNCDFPYAGRERFLPQQISGDVGHRRFRTGLQPEENTVPSARIDNDHTPDAARRLDHLSVRINGDQHFIAERA